jgi:HJR/Mrr/RecB family endonuclease
MNPRYAKDSDDVSWLLSGALLAAVLWHYWHHLTLKQHRQLLWLVGIVQAGCVGLLIVIVLHYRRKKRHTRLLPRQWPKMSGLQFEQQIVIWLTTNGFSPVSTTEYYDQGIDIVAAQNGIVYGVQVKKSSRPVGVAAIRAAVAGLTSYGCEQAIVVTNSVFTAQAGRLAKANNCRLIDGGELIRGLVG